jgi:hypothetical protein
MLSRTIREGSPQGRKGDLIPYDRRVKRVVDRKEVDTKQLTVSPDPLFEIGVRLLRWESDPYPSSTGSLFRHSCSC